MDYTASLVGHGTAQQWVMLLSLCVLNSFLIVITLNVPKFSFPMLLRKFSNIQQSWKFSVNTQYTRHLDFSTDLFNIYLRNSLLDWYLASSLSHLTMPSKMLVISWVIWMDAIIHCALGRDKWWATNEGHNPRSKTQSFVCCACYYW